PAWHGLGTVVTEAQTSEEAIRLAALDWDVEQLPICAEVCTHMKTTRPARLHSASATGSQRASWLFSAEIRRRRLGHTGFLRLVERENSDDARREIDDCLQVVAVDVEYRMVVSAQVELFGLSHDIGCDLRALLIIEPKHDREGEPYM